MIPKSFKEMAEGPLMAGRHLLVAVSGGIDSVTLLHGLASLRERARLKITVAHVNHGLRGAASDADQVLVEDLAAERGLACRVERVDPGALRLGISHRERPTPQEAARRVRYDALRDLRVKLGADAVVTAHNLDDQAETVLLRLLRGASPDGLGGMAPSSDEGRLLRPLLGISRSEIEAWARSANLRWREDASNASDQYTRNRLRRHWLPGLADDFNPQLLRAIARLAEAQRRDSAWIASAVDAAESDWVSRVEGGLSLHLRGWGALPEALSSRLVERALIAQGGGRDLSRSHVQRMLEFLSHPERHEGGRGLELPGGLRLVRESKRFLLRRSDG